MLELQIKDLCVAFNGKEILHNITLGIENGAFIGIVGPSGAGKSTLLKQINRLDPRDVYKRQGHSDPVALNGRAIAQRIKGTLGITG